MSYGNILKEALKNNKTEQLELALDLNYSRQTVSAWANETRKIQDDMLPKVSQKLDYPDLYLESAVMATGGVSIPVLDGDYIERNPSSMKETVQVETEEALEFLAKTRMTKPAKYSTEADKQEMERVIREVLDAACSMINMVSVLCKEYGFSMKDIYKHWFVTLKARRLRK